MGIIFEVFKEGEKYISITEHSVKNIKFLDDTEVVLGHKFNDITRDILLEGIINADKINEELRVILDDFGEPVVDEYNNEKTELREIDSVRKLANWAIVPEYCECYNEVKVKLTNAKGELVKKTEFVKIFIIEYNEIYDDDSGHGKFFIHMRERETKEMAK